MKLNDFASEIKKAVINFDWKSGSSIFGLLDSLKRKFNQSDLTLADFLDQYRKQGIRGISAPDINVISNGRYNVYVGFSLLLGTYDKDMEILGEEEGCRPNTRYGVRNCLDDLLRQNFTRYGNVNVHTPLHVVYERLLPLTGKMLELTGEYLFNYEDGEILVEARQAK